MIALVCSIALTLALAMYIFLPPRRLTQQRQKTRSEYLAERGHVLAENLRDLNFEHRAGKYLDEDFNRERAALAAEQVALDAEAERLARRQ